MITTVATNKAIATTAATRRAGVGTRLPSEVGPVAAGGIRSVTE